MAYKSNGAPTSEYGVLVCDAMIRAGGGAEMIDFCLSSSFGSAGLLGILPLGGTPLLSACSINATLRRTLTTTVVYRCLIS
jgi:hypothetical protein